MIGVSAMTHLAGGVAARFRLLSVTRSGKNREDFLVAIREPPRNHNVL